MTTRMITAGAGNGLPTEVRPEWLELVKQQVESLQFGVVEIVVHDSQVTQIEKTERVRLDKPRPGIQQPKKHKQQEKALTGRPEVPLSIEQERNHEN